MAPTEYTIYRGAEGMIKQETTELPALGPKEILVKITHSGVCGTDVAYMPYGIALGHEGVGIVEAIGSEVTQLKVGDRAGGGFHRDSCGHCHYCLSGQDIWCYERSVFGEKDYNNGTFGEYYVGVETYPHKIPEGLSSEDAAPLQCAGATTYSALVDVLKPGERVGIVGIGGLGHLAIQFASKLGAQVVVFSTSRNKEEEAKQLGASEFYLLDELEKVQKPVQVLVIAGSRYPDWSKFMVKDILARAGTIVPLSAPHGDLVLPYSSHYKFASTIADWSIQFFPSLVRWYNLHLSLVASRGRHVEMLEFAASKCVKPWVEKFELSERGVREAIGKLNSNQMRYRAVLVARDA
ncbi:GroES-like protein [Lindgomyces ingoldianus]|uniref:GroES-like protein n=1 Tax=Lindgomyces ingoldianus TaxID=673940 RepID=A0ACB6QC79_9PLEO|nr:GroES-like protein [Lindgomyces ingoldianus]KAF2464110.1 GroES-like protein [Lindgomyces ingoldianus]